MAYSTQQALQNFQSNKWTADQYNKWAAAYSQGNTGFDPTVAVSAPVVSAPVSTPISTPTQYAGGLAPDDPNNVYNTATGQLNTKYKYYVAPTTSTPATTANPIYANTQPSAGIPTPVTTPAVPTPTTPTPTTTISSANLKVGSKGQSVADLQTFLNAHGANLTVDSNFGSLTQAAVKAYQSANGLTPDGIVGVNTASKMNRTPAPAPALTPITTGVPTTTTTPTLPTPTASATTDTYYQSLNQQVSTLQTQLDTARQDQLNKIQQDKAQVQNELDTLRSQQQGAIDQQGNVALQEKQAKLDQLNIEIQRFDENYKLKQGFVNQLMELTIKGNALILQQKSVTGLQAIRNPRITDTINNITAQTAVLKIGIDAAEGNMTQVRGQLTDATNVITSAYKDQLDYYTTLQDFYKSQITSKTAEKVVLDKDQQNFMDTTITNLQNKIKTIQDNADKLQEMFLSPDNALAFAKAGITITTPQSQWGTLLAQQAYREELATQSKDMANDGWTPLISGNTPAGSTTTQRVDSQGKVKTYWKKATASTEIKSTEAERLSANISQYSSAFVAGAKLSDGTPIIDDNGFITPIAWKKAIASAPADGINRADFIKQFGYLLYKDKDGAISISYGLTPQEIKLITG